MYFFNGKNHREDGPAMISKNAWYWYLNGKEYTVTDWNEITKFYTDEEMTFMKLKDMNE